MSEDLFCRIVTFVEKERWKYSFPLKKDTQLIKDLKMDGDDAYEFIEKFAKEFKVDSSDFKFGDYFSAEGFDLIGIIGSIFKKAESKLKPLTLGDLEQSVITGKLK